MRAYFIATLLGAALLAAAACGEEDAPTRPSPSPALTESALTVGPLELRLQIDKPVYRRGEPVHMSVTVTNKGDTPVTLFFRNSQRYDFTVDCEPDLYCPPIWVWSADKVFAQTLGQETLAPGQSITYSETWDQRDSNRQPVAAGRYPVLGSVSGCLDEAMTDCGYGTGAVTLEIVP